MKAVWVITIVVLLVVPALTDMSGECDMAGYYTELGCTPVSKPDTLCPDAFTCPDLHPDASKCYYRGIAYDDRSAVPQNQINNPCSQACSCQVSSTPRFECAAVDCVQTFDTDMQEQCINVYELDSCCGVNTVCGKDAVAKLKTCEVDGKTYKEGESFEPKNTRKTCICTASFNGSFDDPAYCRDINCGIEIHYQQELYKKCAPIFFGNARSCPIGFQCQSEVTKQVRGLNVRGINAQCTFGNLTLSVGDEVTTDDEKTKCKCNMPPTVTCMKSY